MIFKEKLVKINWHLASLRHALNTWERKALVSDLVYYILSKTMSQCGCTHFQSQHWRGWGQPGVHSEAGLDYIKESGSKKEEKNKNKKSSPLILVLGRRERKEALNLRPTWSTYQIPGRLGLHSETLSLNKLEQQNILRRIYYALCLQIWITKTTKSTISLLLQFCG